MAQRKVVKFELSVSVTPDKNHEDQDDETLALMVKRRIEDLLRANIDPIILEGAYNIEYGQARWVEFKAL